MILNSNISQYMRCFLWLIFLLQKSGVEKGATNQKQFNKVRNTAPRGYKKRASLCSGIRLPVLQLEVTTVSILNYV